MRDLRWYPAAWAEYMELQGNETMLKKVNRILKDIMRNGYNSSYGKVEMLKGGFSGYASVRIDKKNRIIFKADKETVTIVRCIGHYDDK